MKNNNNINKNVATKVTYKIVNVSDISSAVVIEAAE